MKYFPVILLFLASCEPSNNKAISDEGENVPTTKNRSVCDEGGNMPMTLHNYQCGSCHTQRPKGENITNAPSVEEMHAILIANNKEFSKLFYTNTYHRQIVKTISKEDLQLIKCYLINYSGNVIY